MVLTMSGTKCFMYTLNLILQQFYEKRDFSYFTQGHKIVRKRPEIEPSSLIYKFSLITKHCCLSNIHITCQTQLYILKIEKTFWSKDCHPNLHMRI